MNNSPNKMLQKKQDWDAPIDKSSQLYVPLKQVNVNATIRSFAANVTITQIFRNDEAVPIEAVYCFPMEEKAAVYAFVARIDDREIVTQLKEKKQAQQEYDNALREQHGAYMLEQDEESQDNFIINVGALPPNKECHITISYVTELELIENGSKIRFVVPTTIAPRYNPNQGGIGSPANTTTEYVQSAPYTIELHCQVEKFGVSRVSSTSHPIQINLNQEDFYMLEFAQNNTHLDRDIIVDVELDKNRSNTILAVESGAIMASFTPTEQDCRAVTNDADLTNEFIFIVDCSGSMDGENKIGLARQAMLLFLKSLPMNCHFNIIRFGSEYQHLFNDITAIYDDETAQQAEKLINKMTANLGGTELLRPLQWLEEHPPIQDHSRQIFLLSDGEISNVDEVLNLCRSMATSARIFSFGLGASPSRSLIKGLARSTNGRFVFIPPSTNVDVYVGEQLQKALQPCITNIKIKLNMDSTLINIVPTSIPPVFINDRLIIYAITKDEKLTSFDHNLSIELYSEQHRLGVAKINRIPSVCDDGTIVRLAAKALILELQHTKLPSQCEEHDQQQTVTKSNNECQLTKEAINERIVQISLEHNILSPFTAFVGIEKRVNANNVDMVLREVPIEISADNQYLKYLKTRMSQIRHKRAQSQMCYASSRERHDYYEDESRCHQEYAEAMHRLCQAHHRYAESEQNYDMVTQRFMEARSDYEKAQQKLEHVENKKKSSSVNFEEADLQCEETNAQKLLTKAEASLRHWQHEKASVQASLNHQEYAMRSAKKNMNSAREFLDRLAHKKQSAEMRYQMARASLRDDSDVSDDELSSEMHHVEALQRYDHERRSSKKSREVVRTDNQDEQDTVRHLIQQQKFDGLWNVDEKIIVQLTGKSLSNFHQLNNTEMLMSAIIIVVLETHFASLSSMWYGIVQKARKRLIDMLDKDSNRLEALLEDIRKQL